MRENATTDAESFLALLKPIERDLERYCRRLVWEPQEAADALQNAVLRAFAAFDRYHQDASFRAWMFKILTREAFTLNRKHARIARHEFQLEPEELAGLPCPDEQAQDGGRVLTPGGIGRDFGASRQGGVEDADRQRAGRAPAAGHRRMRYREIGESLGMPLGSVMGHLARARQKMRALLARATPRKPQLKEN